MNTNCTRRGLTFNLYFRIFLRRKFPADNKVLLYRDCITFLQFKTFFVLSFNYMIPEPLRAHFCLQSACNELVISDNCYCFHVILEQIKTA